MDHKDFEAAYARLNKEQKEAVDTIEGPVMVIAGPGTGKTQILTLRILQILKETDTKPENILALTFTESGAREMQSRLQSYIGSEAYGVAIHTFHGFAERLIREHPDAYPRIIGGRPIRDVEKIDCIESILATSGVKKLRPLGNAAYYVPHIIRAISLMKQEYITPNAFAEIIARQENDLALIPKFHEKGAHKGKVRGEYHKKEERLQKNKELLLVYKLYDACLIEKKVYDYEDMIVETVRALESNEPMLREVQETFQYVLADEHQDVNGSQNRILELLSSYHDSPNLFVVGDEKQAIYRFQGASLENFLYFEDVFKGAKTIGLVSNYRSGQEVLDASHSLIKVEDGPLLELRRPLVSARGEASRVERRAFPHQAIEDDAVVVQVQALFEEGVSLSEIAVIVRTNKEVEHMSLLLRKKGIAVTASAEGDILSHPIMSSVMDMMQVLSRPENEEALFRVLHAPYWGLSREDLVRICSGRTYATSLAHILRSREVLGEIGVVDSEKALRIGEIIKAGTERSLTHAPHRVLEYVMKESGFLDMVLEQDPLEGTRVVRRLYDEIEAMVRGEDVVTLEGVLMSLRKRLEYRLPLNAPYIHTGKQAVQVMTAHKSKGLEFEHVFIPHLVENIWSGGKRAEYFDIPLTKHIGSDLTLEGDDERRLFYVALTRAKDAVYLSYSETNSDGKVLAPSRFLGSIDVSLVNVVDTADVVEDFKPFSALGTHSGISALDIDFLASLFRERGLSATSLNNYLRSPWNYFYRNLLRVPELQSLRAQFGTALHNTMQSVTQYRKEKGGLPSEKELRTFLERELGKLAITDEEYTRLHEEGYGALLAYLAHVESLLPHTTKEEFGIRVMMKTGNDLLPEILLTGKLDRLDLDVEGKLIRVVDYKSGKPKTRGAIEGTTKSSDGDYKRQLVFYALLLSLLEDERYQSRTFTLSFVEPDSKGQIHEETYLITDDEVEALKEEVIRVGIEITSGVFLETVCDPAKSDYCALAESFVNLSLPRSAQEDHSRSS